MLPVRLQESATTLADATEAHALATGQFGYSLEDLKTGLRQGGTPDEPGFDPAAEDALVADRGSDVSEEIIRRLRLMPGSYPFDFDGTVITPRDDALSTPYAFLLLLSRPELNGKIKGRVYFEEVIADALAAHLGGDCARFGWPRSRGMPPDADSALDHLSRLIGEPRSHLYPIRRSRDKDMGLDVVAWKDFVDRRRGKVMILGQCATGEDWRGKMGDLLIERWNNFIGFTVAPTKLFAVPWILEDDDYDWIRSHGMMVMDRGRAAHSLGRARTSATVTDWCTKRLRDPVLT